MLWQQLIGASLCRFESRAAVPLPCRRVPLKDIVRHPSVNEKMKHILLSNHESVSAKQLVWMEK